MKKFLLIAKTFQGLEHVLYDEIKNLGGENLEIKKRMVSFYGDQKLMYKSNLYLRTALRILKPIFSSNIKNEYNLYNDIKSIEWEKKIDINSTFKIDSIIKSNYFRNSMFVSQKCKDAIVDRFREKFGKRPNIKKDNPDIVINIHINNTSLNVSLDSSGESLHKRGYRKKSIDAPINEVLASGILFLSEWHKNQNDIIDPMCGSGTILTEAAMISFNIPANFYRENFSFMNFKDYDSDLYNNIKNTARNEININRKINFQGFDIDKYAINVSKININELGLNDIINITKGDFFSLEKTENKTIFFNPPYGNRLNIDKIFYKNIGERLRSNYSKCNVWIITSALEEVKTIGLKSSKRIPILNGKLDSRLLNYKIN